MRAVLATLVGMACTAPEGPTAHPEPRTVVDVSAPWSQVPARAGELAFRFDDSPHGVRVGLIPTDTFSAPGIALVTDGRTVGRPLLGVPGVVGPPRALSVSSEGYDLLVRFSSRPLADISDDPDAPNDPALTWLRLRPRNGSWRLVLDGLGTVNLAAERITISTEGAVRVDGEQGRFELQTNAPSVHTVRSPGSWSMDTSASVHERQPYPRTGITWTPVSP